MTNPVRLAQVAALAAQWAAPFAKAVDWPLIERDLASPEPRAGWSINGNSRMVQARDGWLAITLARADDRASVAAWLEAQIDADPWEQVAQIVPHSDCATLIERAQMLGLPVGVVAELQGATPVHIRHQRAAERRSGQLRVLDLSALWAGPLCAGLLASTGADVCRIENPSRMDPTPRSSPLLNARINGAKRKVPLDLASSDGRAVLLDHVAGADVLVTSARARGLAGLGLTPETVFAINPALIWVAITAHGWASTRVGFGDDAAAAGGLVHWCHQRPDFLGDALADPLTGVLAARTAMEMAEGGQAGLIDVALATVAGHAAALLA